MYTDSVRSIDICYVYDTYPTFGDPLPLAYRRLGHDPITKADYLV